jgi:hypothetical protein
MEEMTEQERKLVSELAKYRNTCVFVLAILRKIHTLPRMRVGDVPCICWDHLEAIIGDAKDLLRDVLPSDNRDFLPK